MSGLKEFLQLDYRKLAALLNDCPELCATIELHVVPHYTTFQKAAQRLLRSRPAGRLLDKTIRLAKAQGRIKTKIPLAAGDGTGWESRTSATTTSGDGQAARNSGKKPRMGVFPRPAFFATAPAI